MLKRNLPLVRARRKSVPSSRFRIRFAIAGASALLVLAALLTAAAPGWADEDAKAKVAVSKPASAAVEVLEAGPAKPDVSKPVPLATHPDRTRMLAEFRSVFESERAKLANLRVQFAAAVNASAALAIQREIEKCKADTEISLLRIQEKHARQAGRLELARRIDVAIQQLTTPRQRLAPTKRPVPAAVKKAAEH